MSICTNLAIIRLLRFTIQLDLSAFKSQLNNSRKIRPTNKNTMLLTQTPIYKVRG